MPTVEYPDSQVDEYRYVLVEDSDWSEPVIDAFKDRMSNIGIYVDEVYWSGFCSQGDGAMFEGSVADWDRYLKHLGYDDPVLISLAEYSWSMKWTHYGHYYHHKSVSYSEDLPMTDNPFRYAWGHSTSDDDDFRAAVWDAAIAKYDEETIFEAIKEDLEDHMQTLYHELEEEHDSLTTDEAVIDWLQANEIEPETETTDELE